MSEILPHSPTQDEQSIITYRFVENELYSLNEIFDLLFERLEKEDSS